MVERGSFRLGPLDLELSWADRLAIVGPNGSGKTTLLDAILGRVPLAAARGGSARASCSARSRSSGASSRTDRCCRRSRSAAGVNEEAARTLLAKFGLGADHVLRDAASLSPGERTRALIALLVARGVNCLVLDEPTNHLDVAAIEELERALDAFPGRSCS